MPNVALVPQTIAGLQMNQGGPLFSQVNYSLVPDQSSSSGPVFQKTSADVENVKQCLSNAHIDGRNSEGLQRMHTSVMTLRRMNRGANEQSPKAPAESESLVNILSRDGMVNQKAVQGEARREPCLASTDMGFCEFSEFEDYFS